MMSFLLDRYHFDHCTFSNEKIKMDPRPVRARMAFCFTTLAVMIFSGNLFLAEADRPELLTRTFSS